MKRLILILLISLSISPTFAQPGGGWPVVFLNENNKEVDTLRKYFLALFDSALFNISEKDMTITATMKDSVLTIGMISATIQSDSFYLNHPAWKDQWIQYVIQIKLQTKMQEWEKNMLKKFNEDILQKMKDLPKKLGIEHCHVGKDMYYGKTKKDKDKVDEYEKQKLRLYGQLAALPMFSTKHLDVYISDDEIFEGYIQHPEWEGYYLVPDSANSLRWKIWDEIKEIEKKFGK